MQWHSLMARIPRPRSFWSPRYIRDRIALAAWRASHGNEPWLAPRAVEFLDQWIRPTDRIAEFGSGRSTSWFAQRAREVCSVEHNVEWHQRVSKRLGELKLRNVCQQLIADGPAYAHALDGCSDGGFHIALVDGMQREHCALWALEHLRPAGLLAIDDVHRYLPTDSHAPFAIAPDAPPLNASWATFWERVGALRRVTFHSGITSTMFIFMEPSD